MALRNPQSISDHPVWGNYLAQQSKLIAGLADQVRGEAAGHDGSELVWVPPGAHLDVSLIADVAVWRAANGVHSQDRRPTGPEQLLDHPRGMPKAPRRALSRASDDPVNPDRRHELTSGTFKDRRHQSRGLLRPAVGKSHLRSHQGGAGTTRVESLDQFGGLGVT